MLLLLLLSNEVGIGGYSLEFFVASRSAAGVLNDLDRWRPTSDQPNPIVSYSVLFSSFLFSVVVKESRFIYDHLWFFFSSFFWIISKCCWSETRPAMTSCVILPSVQFSIIFFSFSISPKSNCNNNNKTFQSDELLCLAYYCYFFVSFSDPI